MVELVRELGAGDPHGARVDDHDVIAKVLMGRIIRLVLALQTVRYLRGQSAQSFACRIDQEPVAAGLFRLGKYGIHENTQLFQVFNEARKCTERRAEMPAPRHLTCAYNIVSPWIPAVSA